MSPPPSPHVASVNGLGWMASMFCVDPGVVASIASADERRLDALTAGRRLPIALNQITRQYPQTGSRVCKHRCLSGVGSAVDSLLFSV